MAILPRETAARVGVTHPGYRFDHVGCHTGCPMRARIWRKKCYCQVAFGQLQREVPVRRISRRARLARDVLHDRDGALADERDGHRVGAHAVARDAAGGVGGVEQGVLTASS